MKSVKQEAPGACTINRTETAPCQEGILYKIMVEDIVSNKIVRGLGRSTVHNPHDSSLLLNSLSSY